MGNKGFIKLTSNPRGVKSGYDQAFTLQKGVSAAPIKQVKISKVREILLKNMMILS